MQLKGFNQLDSQPKHLIWFGARYYFCIWIFNYGIERALELIFIGDETFLK